MPRDLPVTEIMTGDVISLRPEMSVEDALAQLSERNISGAPVVDPDGRLVGLVDDSDLLISEARLHGPTTIELLGAYITLPGEQRRFNEEVRHALARTVAEIMDRKPPSVPRTATVEDAATLMVDRQVSRVAVVDEDGHVVGIVTRGDLVGAMYRHR